MIDALGAVQSVLVLGGTSEIGLAVVRALLEERPVRVVLAGRDGDRLAAAARALPGAQVACEPWDAADVARQGPRLGEIFAAHGDLDLVVVAAGVLGDAAATDDPAAAARLLEVNLVGCGAALLAAAARLRAQGHGHLLVLSSVAGERARRANFVYGASKAGLDALAQGLADSLAGTGVGVTVVRPGFVRTKMTAGLREPPLAATAERVAADALAGVRAGAHTVWSPPAMRWVMRAMRIVPRPLWRRMRV